MKVDSNTIVVGASAAGLACAATLKRRGLPYILLEQYAQVAQPWRNHYDRLYLHTNKGNSHLPYLKFPKSSPKYVSRDALVQYFENYVTEFDLKPTYNVKVNSIKLEGDHWITTTANRNYVSKNVIIATGHTRIPNIPAIPDSDNYQDRIIHSSEYKNGKPFHGKKVLVVGFGNSACEIAICLHEHGAIPTMSVRHPVNILPRDLFGIPILTLGIAMSIFPPKLADKLGAPLLRWRLGDYTKYGLKKHDYGPQEQISKYKNIPLLDIGTLSLIKSGNIRIRPGIKAFHQDQIQFQDNTEDSFHAIIMGTGWKTGLADILNVDNLILDEKGLPDSNGKESAIPGLYFCGFNVSATGMLREINIESKVIAKDIMAKSK